MRQTIVDDLGLINIIFLQYIFLHLLDSGRICCQFRQFLTKAFHLQFQFHILLYQIVIDIFQMEITSHLIGCFISPSGQPIGRSEIGTSLVMIELEQQSKAYHLQQDEKEPIVVLQKEIQQISHQELFLCCL